MTRLSDLIGFPVNLLRPLLDLPMGLNGGIRSWLLYNLHASKATNLRK